jgi:hypothetical protein
MKYTIGLTLVTYLGCLVSLISIANANNLANYSTNSLKIANAAPIQNANTKEFDRTILAEAKSYQLLVQAAEELAAQLIQQTLQASQVETIIVRVVGDRFGEVAPILTVRVARADWQAQPNIRTWARYGGRSSMQLLGYLGPKPLSGSEAIAVAPAVAPQPQSEANPGAAPAPAMVPAAATTNPVPSRSVVAPGRESPIPGQVPEASDPGYR